MADRLHEKMTMAVSRTRFSRPFTIDSSLFRRPASRFRSIFYTVAFVIIGALLGTMLWLRYYGLPDRWQAMVQNALRERGISVQMSRLFLEPWGEIGADHLVLFQTDQQRETRLEVDRVRLGLNWLSWMRGGSFLSSASIHHAELAYPLNQSTQALLRDVQAQIDILPDALLIQQATASLLNLQVSLRGSLKTRGFTPGPPLTPEQMAARAKLWNQIESWMEEVKSPDPLQLSIQCDTSLADPLGGRIHLVLEGQNFYVRDVWIPHLQMTATLENHNLTIETIDLRLARGGLQARGQVDLNTGQGRVHIHSTVDPLIFAPWLPADRQMLAASVLARKLPAIQATLELGGATPFLLYGRGTAQQFQVGHFLFDSISAPFSWDGRRLMFTGVTLRSGQEELLLDFLREADGSVQGYLKSNLSLDWLRHLAGPGAQPFFKSLQMDRAPEIEARIRGTSLHPDFLRAEGKVRVQHFTYKGTRVLEASGNFVFEQGWLEVTNGFLRTTSGETRAHVRYQPRTRMVQLLDGFARLDLVPAARIFSSKLAEYLEPYRFRTPPQILFSGVIDVDHQTQTDLHLDITGDGPMDYTFLGRDLVLGRLRADVCMKGSTLQVKTRQPAQLFEGAAHLDLTVELIQPAPTYQATVRIENANFNTFMQTFFENDQVTGRMNGALEIRGVFDHWESLSGSGNVSVADGFLYAIPIFGGLSELLRSTFGDIVYSKAENAVAPFTIEKGLITSPRFEMASKAFVVIGKGTYNFLRDHVDMDVRVNVKGLVGALTYVVSKFFEYHGTGSLENTRWEPKSF